MGIVQAMMRLIRIVRDVHQNLSWKVGFARGKKGRPWSCPWWADRTVYGVAYVQGVGANIASTLEPSKDR